MSNGINWKAHNKKLIQSAEFREAMAEHCKHIKETIVDPCREELKNADSPESIRRIIKKY